MEIVLSKQAQKQIKHLPPPEQKKVKKKPQSLEINPLIGKKLIGELKTFWSLRVWPYRIIYRINKIDKWIEVTDIEHRQSAYK